MFSPAKLPDPIWNSIKANTYDVQKHKFLFSLQSTLLNSIKPILSVLPKINDKNVKSELFTSIQMLTSVNLDINRFRRIMASPYLKPEFKKAILKLPINHSSLFGEEDFEKCSDKIIKEVNASSKLLKTRS